MRPEARDIIVNVLDMPLLTDRAESNAMSNVSGTSPISWMSIDTPSSETFSTVRAPVR